MASLFLDPKRRYPSSSSLNSEDLSQDDSSLILKIDFPDFQTQRTICVRQSDVIYMVKMQLIHELPEKVPDMFNYGLFLPPFKGRIGKFLLEDRIFKEYAFDEVNTTLQLKYKGRLQSAFDAHDRQMKRINGVANRKKLMRYIKLKDVAKVEDICRRGLDPNFIDPLSLETPLTIAASKSDNCDILMALANAGAHLDFRNLAGQTALHKAAVLPSSKNVKTLLELRSSPYYKDSVGLTPLYYCVSCENSSSDIAELLLRDYSEIGIVDVNGNQEIHTACRNGLAAHLEHLLFYKADPNCHNFNGNTPLHVCASRNQVSCAKVLLFRGSDPNIMNKQQQTPYHLAVLAGSPDIANLLKNYDSSKSVPYRGAPLYNSKRKWRRVRTIAKPSMSSLSEYDEYGQGATSTTHNITPSQLLSRDSEVGYGAVTSAARVPGNMTLAVDQRQFLASAMKQALTGKCKVMPYDASVIRTPSFCSSYPPCRDSSTQVRRSHTIVIPRGPRGFGFVLTGAKRSDAVLQFEPSDDVPSLQYFESVDPDGNAMKAGVKPGDFLLELNGIDVRCMPHGEVVKLIEAAGSSLLVCVITVVDSQQPETPHLSYRQAKTVGRCNGARLFGEGRSTSYRPDARSLYNFPCSSSAGAGGSARWAVSERTIPEEKVANIRERPSSKISVHQFDHLLTTPPNRRCNGVNVSQAYEQHCNEPRVYGSVSQMKRQRQKPPAKPNRTVSLIKDAKSSPDLHRIFENHDSENQSADDASSVTVAWRKPGVTSSLHKFHSISRPSLNDSVFLDGGRFDSDPLVSEAVSHPSSGKCTPSSSHLPKSAELPSVIPPPPPLPVSVVTGARSSFGLSSQLHSQNGYRPVIKSTSLRPPCEPPPPPMQQQQQHEPVKETGLNFSPNGGVVLRNKGAPDCADSRCPSAVMIVNRPGRNLDFEADLRNALTRRRNMITSGSESLTDVTSDSKEFTSFTSSSSFSKAFARRTSNGDVQNVDGDFQKGTATGTGNLEHDSMSVASTLSTLSGCSAGSESAAIPTNKTHASNASSSSPCASSAPHYAPSNSPGLLTAAGDYELADSGKGDSDGDERKETIPDGSSLKNKPVRMWTPEDVATWLDTLRLRQYKDSFVKADINGQKLLLFGPADYASVGVTQVVHRTLLENSLDTYATSSKL